MNKNSKIIILIIVIIAAIAIAGLYLSGTLTSGGSNEEGSIDVLVGAGFSKVGADLISEFNKKYPNIKVNAKYGGSGELFATLETQKSGDVFLPADYKYMEDAMNNGYMENNTVKNITKNVPVIVVQKGNPKNITSLEDLAKPGVKVGVGEPDGPAIGKTTQKILEKNNLTDSVQSNVVVTTTTVNQLLTYIVTGQVDATIIWEDMTVWKEGDGKIEVIEIPADENIESTVPIGITSFVKDKPAADKFEEFVTSEEGKQIWKKWGFEI
ncbi:MAG: molybdate ABC transporter substrate-binding protein [Methanobrevibacter arboriphilus]|jgi:molybdate transport system substrate-binding protein|uniref:Molybdenum ABC transporter substrate-binding protein n=2 Tax=Methanobrevibacter arboriphilus TaxID=39441 RepID=A0ACA8R481_METAZ|nr:molybdate ABC transporter substrate-binding protein [Methanobrevibacter arboriphilus]MBF4468940.1 molybdate ABC transporter substrate-binding protein [Methanobrevibacter arboriphilus]MCC7561465.1 molybdate ABC transporter substrate-binding protein [Methanobrevibacter arboriphilus]BBL62331.1 molybdenum ABC transporter substrate-binding protein [Methanobrevibacter arboriphilus]